MDDDNDETINKDFCFDDEKMNFNGNSTMSCDLVVHTMQMIGLVLDWYLESW